ncbi:hypothetical protein DUNSADRAFT_16997 [Dunaliella salina]|uniref:Encoded protein n=1 Tax=Dunaliella salina TaxID=3046 RepID=A0ABQ7G2L0_DUNSA|nr:hypothetical protein DUNSADRAFT_16997 [Dunaliella salina]|eukprot:KAF5828837.1 hypothetical protein DUNSADRAFT_16997 [Dunaliella salina]
MRPLACCMCGAGYSHESARKKKFKQAVLVKQPSQGDEAAGVLHAWCRIQVRASNEEKNSSRQCLSNSQARDGEW